jgi:hypothetical protein
MSCLRSRLPKPLKKFEILPPLYHYALQEAKPLPILRSDRALPNYTTFLTLSIAIRLIKKKKTFLQEPPGWQMTLPGPMITKRPTVTTFGLIRRTGKNC